jgi:hypothetical protein
MTGDAKTSIATPPTWWSPSSPVADLRPTSSRVSLPPPTACRCPKIPIRRRPNISDSSRPRSPGSGARNDTSGHTRPARRFGVREHWDPDSPTYRIARTHNRLPFSTPRPAIAKSTTHHWTARQLPSAANARPRPGSEPAFEWSVGEAEPRGGDGRCLAVPSQPREAAASRR